MYVLVLEEWIRTVYALPLSLPDITQLALRPSEHLKKLAMFGILEEGKEWVAVLKRRAEASDVQQKEGLVPEMTLREYDRWRDGVSSRFCFFRVARSRRRHRLPSLCLSFFAVHLTL